jgi:hypothetical protein
MEVVLADSETTITFAPGGERVAAARGAAESFGLEVSIESETLAARSFVWLGPREVEPPLAGFFEGMNQDWQGWDGDRVWESYEGGLAIAARNDGLGHIRLSVKLREGSGYGWLAQVTLTVDAGQLGAISRGLAHSANT